VINQKLIEYLSQFLTEHRLNLINQKIQDRTHYIIPVLEDIFDPHNTSAVIRTAEALGIQKINIIENHNSFKMSKGITKGAHQWVDVTQYNDNNSSKSDNTSNSKKCINALKEKGYIVYGATPHEEAFSLEEVDLSKKIAVCFGSEKNGLSDYLLENCDQKFYIPMTGFTESLNISVSTAITIHHLLYNLNKSDIKYKLSREEQLELKYQWLRKSLKRIDILEKEFYSY